jgi:hypothetical protein
MARWSSGRAPSSGSSWAPATQATGRTVILFMRRVFHQAVSVRKKKLEGVKML